MAYVFDTLPAQRNLVNLADAREVAWWCKRFGCSAQQLRDAVVRVGPGAAQVEQWLDGATLITV